MAYEKELAEQLEKSLAREDVLKKRIAALESLIDHVASGATKSRGGSASTPVQKAIADAMGIDLTKPAPVLKSMSVEKSNAILTETIKAHVEPELKKDTGYRPNALGIRIAEENLRNSQRVASAAKWPRSQVSLAVPATTHPRALLVADSTEPDRVGDGERSA